MGTQSDSFNKTEIGCCSDQVTRMSRAGARWAEEVICHQDRSKFNRWTNTLQCPGRAQYCDADPLSTVLFCHARFSLVTLLPSPPLSPRPILSWSIFNMWQWITSQLPCLVPQEISWLKTATSLTWWLCVGITTHHIMCTSLNSNSCREMVTSWLVTICSAQISSHNSQWAEGRVKIFGSFPFQLFYSIVNRKWLTMIYKKKQVSKIYVHTDTPVFCHTNVCWHLNY